MKIVSIGDDTEFLQKTIFDLREEVDQLRMLHDISRQLLSNYNYDQIINIFFDIVKELINYNFCILYLFKENLNSFQASEFRGVDDKDLERFKPDIEIIRWVLNEGRWTNVSLPMQSESEDKEFFSILPLQGANKNLGFLLIATDAAHNIFTQSNMNHLSFIASQTALALENQGLYSKLRQSRDYIGNILESINNGIVIIDMADRITQLNKNATAMLGLPSADIIGFRYQEVLPGKLIKMIDEVRQRALADGFAFETLFEYSPAKDFHVPLGINSSLLLDDNADRIGTIIVFRNMFVLKELDRLRQLDELKSEFVSNVSHELRSPLSVIKSYVEAMLDQVDPVDYQTQREFLSVIDDETDRLTDLVNDLLDISRIESGNFEIDRSRIHLNEIMSIVMRGIEDKSRKHQIVADIPDNLPDLWADKDKMVQVFLNLLDNAIKFSPAGGKVVVKAGLKREMVKCEIIDQGIGIAKKNIPRIFDKFFRVDNSDAYEIPGTGLGLPIVKHIVESHGGKISVISQPDTGSTFNIFFPFVEDKTE
jgi:two-component system phosphate regulon sensor histidine kinase PhoR